MQKRYLILAALLASSSAAYAADFGVVNQPVPEAYIAPASDWTGFYAGVFGGLTSGPIDFSLVPDGAPSVLDISINAGGALGGAQIGYDVQFDGFVIGAVADIAVSNHHAGAEITTPGGSLELETGLNFIGTVRARAGYAFDDALAYVHGGFAYGQSDVSLSLNGTDVDTGIDDVDHIGFVVGAGLEYQVTENISFQTEYAYTQFGDETLVSLPGGSITQEFGFHTVKAGVNFRF